MSSPQGLRFELSTTPTSTTNVTNTNNTNIQSTHILTAATEPPSPQLLHQQQPRPGVPLVADFARPFSLVKPPGSPSRRAADEDGNISEAETVVLRGPVDSARIKEPLSLGNGDNKREWTGSGKERRRGGNMDTDDNDDHDDDSPRKRRRRSLSRSAASGRNASDERRSRGYFDNGDAEYSSELSSARSSSPMRRDRDFLHAERDGPRPERSRSHPQLTSQRHGSNARKRKAPTDGTITSDDEPNPELGVRPRRRNSTLESSPQTRKHSIRLPSPLLPHPRLSPTRATKSRAQPGLKKQRKIPPPLNTSRGDPSDNDSSSSLSRQGSPTRYRHIHFAAARTPGSPVGVSHKPKRDTAGRTHLHRACGRGAVQEVESILEQGVELVNAEDNAGYMPIHEASLNGHLEVVKVLVQYGASYDVQSSIDLESPLLDAVENGHVPVVRYLLELGADPRKRDKQGRSCLDANNEGEENGEVRDEIEALLKAAIKQRPAQRASDDENNRASVPANRDSPSSRDASVASPAHQSPPAPRAGRRRNARAEQSRKDLLWLDSGKGSVAKLREKAREGDFQMVHALLETGLKPDTEALVGAIKGGHAELVSLLLAYAAEADPEPGQVDREGGRRKREVSMPIGEETPMLAAIGRGNVTILRYLLENGVDPRRKDSKGKSYPEIAREREGEAWQEEVQLLKEAWQKAGDSSLGETKSPSRHKSSPKSRSSAKQLRRNSSASSSSRTRSRPPTKRLTDDKSTKRSLSANSPHRLGDLPAVSDRESTAEPLGPPKTRFGRPKRNDSETLTPGVAKRRRRLVSGKVRDEEAARVGDSLLPLSEHDSDGMGRKQKLSAKVSADTSDMEDTIIVKEPKIEPSEDVKMEDTSPLNRPKGKPTRERRQSTITTRADGAARDAKRTRSPPKPPRLDIERRQEQEQLRRRKREGFSDDRDRYSRRRDSLVEEPRRLREGRHPEQHPRPPSVASETPRRRGDSRRPNRDELDKPHQAEEERRRRIPDKEKDDERERRDKKPKEERQAKEKKLKELDLGEGITKGQIDQEAREILRKKCLIKELASVQKKASKESRDRRADEVITRELELRRLREQEEHKQRAIREQEEREQEERKAREKAENEQREREAKEQEELERAAKAKEEQERLEKAVQERENREKEEKERVMKERVEQERKEKEARELQEREAKEREVRLEEERQREAQRQQEEERRKEQELREKLAAEAEERRRKEEAEKQRLEQERLEERRRTEEAERRRKAAEEEEAKRREFEREKAEREARDRKVAEELQRQIAQEQEARRIEERAKEAARIQSLPYTLRIAAEREARGQAPEDFRHFIPLFAATFLTASHPSNGVAHTPVKWVLNIQVALALEINDLTFDGYQLAERRPATEHERLRMWSALSPILCEDMTWSTKTMHERAASRMVDKEKYLNVKPVFWIKFDDILSIVSSDSRHEGLFNHPLTTVDVIMDLPTSGKGSPGHTATPSREEMANRIKNRFSPQSLKHIGFNASTSNSSNPHSSKSMPPPAFGINNNSSG